MRKSSCWKRPDVASLLLVATYRPDTHGGLLKADTGIDKSRSNRTSSAGPVGERVVLGGLPLCRSGAGWRRGDGVQVEKGLPCQGAWGPSGTELMNVGAVNRNRGTCDVEVGQVILQKHRTSEDWTNSSCNLVMQSCTKV